MLKVGGIWVSPAEIEHLLIEHPAVQACGVTGREDHDGLIKPVAHVVLRPGHEPEAELVAALQQFARQRLSEYKRPRWIEFVDALPLTATGKVQRFKLRSPSLRSCPDIACESLAEGQRLANGLGAQLLLIPAAPVRARVTRGATNTVRRRNPDVRSLPPVR